MNDAADHDIARLLEARRPSPRPSFEGDLGRAVTEAERTQRVRPRPAGLWLRATALVVAGGALLAAAAAQL